MTDLLEGTDTTDTSPAPSANQATSTPLPPPPPKSLDDGVGPKRQWILAVVGAIALVAAVVMGLLWVSAMGSRDDAATERDAARAAATTEADRAASALDSLAATEVDLESVRSDNEQLTAELAAAEADAAETAAATVRADEAESTLAIVNVQNEELAAEVARLKAALADAEASADATGGQAGFDIDTSPDLARYIGEELSSSSGPTVLGQGQTTCLGNAVVNDIGLSTLGTGLASGASTSDTAAVVEAIERAAVTCGIDPSAIF